jgi:hypothetical protein
MAGVFFLLVLFPNGVVHSRRWLLLAKLVPISFAIVGIGISTSPEMEPPYEDFENPLAITDDADYIVAIFPFIFFCLISIAAAGINLVLRFRRSQGDEREQYKWLAFAAGLLVASMPFTALSNWEGIAGAVFSVALVGLPVSVGIAVLKYRLYDIDLLINRTLVYVPLTAIVIGIYTALVGVLKTLATEVSGTQSDAAVAMATLLVVVLLTPLKNQLQSLVDRYFKEKTLPAQELRKLANQARAVLQVVDTDEFVRRFLSDLTTSVRAEGSAIELRNGGTPQLITTGYWRGAANLSLPLRHKEHEIGVLEIGPRADGRPYDPSETEALNESADVLAHALDLNQRI